MSYLDVILLTVSMISIIAGILAVIIYVAYFTYRKIEPLITPIRVYIKDE